MSAAVHSGQCRCGATRIQVQGRDEDANQSRIQGAFNHRSAVFIELIEIEMTMGIGERHWPSAMHEGSGVKYLPDT